MRTEVFLKKNNGEGRLLGDREMMQGDGMRKKEED